MLWKKGGQICEIESWIMKVTVCFGNVRVIVPCGDGEILVKDLIQKAITRYKKATGKPSESWVSVHNLKTLNDGGILDPDDSLNDVADDREQIIAIYEEHGNTSYLVHNGGVGGVGGGDGTSASSSGDVESPDIFRTTDDAKSDDQPYNSNTHHNQYNSSTDVEITGDEIPSGLTLQVRRGSEPALNRLSPMPGLLSDPMKRWSTAVVLEDKGADCTILVKDENGLPSDDEILSEREDGSSEEKSSFSRHSWRLSILGNNPQMCKWADAADRQLIKMPDAGSATFANGDWKQEIGSDRGLLVVLRNDGAPLGIHVVPDCDDRGRDTGLVVQGIEPGGKIDRDGRIRVRDRIVEINGRTLCDVSFHKAQDLFKEALQSNEIRLRLVKNGSRLVRRPPPPVFPKPGNRIEQSAIERSNGQQKGGEENGSATVGLKKAAIRNGNIMLSSNTRKIGKKIHIQLVKGPDGLGFSITTRDNLAAGNCPIYIKNILPKGAAIRDGGLRPGDRLLEVNGIEMTGKSQTEAVNVLRNVPAGGTVNIVVSRQEPDSPKLPRELMGVLGYTENRDMPYQAAAPHSSSPPEKTNEDAFAATARHREIFTFDVPLNDTGSAGLGVSVKGKTSTTAKGVVDLGIFVKSVIHGGAASKDGRLRKNDQLVNINGVSLLGMSNSHAMDTLRRAMRWDGPNPGAMTLTVARRAAGSGNALKGTEGISPYGFLPISAENNSRSDSRSLTSDSASRHSTSENSDSTVIFLPRSLDGMEDAGHPSNQPEKPPRNDSYHRATNDSVGRARRFSKHLENKPSQEDVYAGSQSGRGHEVHWSTTIPPIPQSQAELRSPGESDVTYNSQMSLDEAGNFARDGFGRQSMSEKRNAQLDARNTDTYQRNKKAREERQRQIGDHNHHHHNHYHPHHHQDSSPRTGGIVRSNSADSVISVTKNGHHHTDADGGKERPRLRSSSLESLSGVQKDSVEDDDKGYGQRGSQVRSRSVRNRGCNESFRAAVDRSYDAPLGNAADMETLDEEADNGRGFVHRTTTGDLIGAEDFYQYIKKGKKKSGILKNLGSVFKFGKSRKLATDSIAKLSHDELERQRMEMERLQAKKAAQDEAERIREQYKKLMERQRHVEPSALLRPVQANGISVGNHAGIGSGSSSGSGSAGRGGVALVPPPPQRQQERISQLRSQHQRKHVARQGHYPQDDRDPNSEMQQQEHADRKRYESEVIHSRSRSYDTSRENESRPGAGLVAETIKSSHYMNYEEIQQHIMQQAAYFEHSHSWRERRISNYYEYESVKNQPLAGGSGRHGQVSGNGNEIGNTNSIPRIPKRPQRVKQNQGPPLPPPTHSHVQTKDGTYGHNNRIANMYEPFDKVKVAAHGPVGAGGDPNKYSNMIRGKRDGSMTGSKV